MRKITTFQILVMLAIIAGGISTYFAVKHFVRDARYEFYAQLFEKFDELHDLLSQLRPGNTMREEDVSSMFIKNDTPMISQTRAEIPLSILICGKTELIIEHFSLVSLALTQEVISDPDGFMIWGKKLKSDFNLRRSVISKEIDRIKAIYEKNPEAFYNSLTLTTIGKTSDGKLYFRLGDSDGCLVDNMLKIDIDTWLKDVVETAARYKDINPK